MFNTHDIYQKLRPEMGDAAADTLVSTLGAMYDELRDTVTKSDFRQLDARLQEIAVIGARTDKRLDSLTEKVEALAVAQARTEKRVEELAEAQARTEKRLDSLTGKVEALAEAQARTERSLAQLTDSHVQLRSEVGSMQRSMSYALENEAFRLLPAHLRAAHGFTVHDRLLRRYIGDHEINLLAIGERDGRSTLLVGECKQTIRPSDVGECRRQLAKHSELAREAYGVDDVFLVLIAHSAHPRAIEALGSDGIHVIQSHEWQEAPRAA